MTAQGDLGWEEELEVGQGERHDQLHDWQGPVQNENAGLFIQKLLRISRGQKQSIKPRAGCTPMKLAFRRG